MRKLSVIPTRVEESKQMRSLDSARDDRDFARDDRDFARDDRDFARDDETSYQHGLGISQGTTEWTSTGKEIAQLWESGVPRVVHKIYELFTKLSTEFSTAIAEICSTIHRPYYYNYFI